MQVLSCSGNLETSRMGFSRIDALLIPQKYRNKFIFCKVIQPKKSSFDFSVSSEKKEIPHAQ